jgi:hypothetical protein
MKTNPPHPLHSGIHNSAWLRRSAWLLVLAVLIAPLARVYSQGNVPDRMSYQGYLIDNNGVAFATNGPANYKVRFKIFDAGNNPLWAEEQVVTIDNGYFSVMLGEGSEVTGFSDKHLLTPVFSGSTASERYLGVEVDAANNGTFTPILPRARLLPSPYAFLAQNAKTAESVSGGGITGKIALANLPDSLTGAAWTESAGNVYRAGGNVGIGTASPTAKLDVNGGVKIAGNNSLELGAGIAGKETSAGTISYKGFSDGLDIVGANQTDSASDRKITMWAESGTTFNGNVSAPSVTTSDATVNNALNFGNWKPFATKTWTGLTAHELHDTGKSTTDWVGCVAGFQATGDINESSSQTLGVRVVKGPDPLGFYAGNPAAFGNQNPWPNANWYIYTPYPTESFGSYSITVTVLFIRKGWVSEE